MATYDSPLKEKEPGMAVILIVEDEVFIREIAELMIQDWGHHTLVASDVDEALVHLRSAEHIDALFTDIYLKKLVLGGCDLARQAIELRPELRGRSMCHSISYAR